MRRCLTPLLLILVALLAVPVAAFAHAVPVERTPAKDSADNPSPSVVTVRFSEPVTLLDPSDMEVVNQAGADVVVEAPRVAADAADTITATIRPGLPNGTYTVRYRVVSADSHIIPGSFAFAVGPGPVAPPNLGGSRNEGPSITGGWAVSARFLELVGLGGLLGLLAFRWTVWAPVWRGPSVSGVSEEERDAALTWGRDLFWVAFGVLAVASMIAEAYLLVTYSASALGTTMLETIGNAAGIGDVLATTRLGSLLQLRGALLFALFGLGAWQFLAEFGSSGQPKPARPTGAAVPAAIMCGLILVVLYGISSQGHASQAPWEPVQVGADLVHLGAAAVWIAGLAITARALAVLPRVAPVSGTRLATAVLSRFSAVALVALTAVVVTGTVRSVGQLSDPAQLWETAYGQSIIVKLSLLGVVAAVAMRNRRITNTLVLMPSPSRAGLGMVRRAAIVELALALAVVLVASLLVAQVPGRV